MNKTLQNYGTTKKEALANGFCFAQVQTLIVGQ
jgi:hypothetical protein